MQLPQATMLFLIASLALAAGWALIVGRRAAGARKVARAAYFDACLPLFSDVRQGASDHGFARINGRYRGHLFDLQVVPDMLSYRKLPALWLLVTMAEPTSLRARVNLLMRPAGSEGFSAFAGLRHPVTPPPGFPDHLAIRTDDPAGLPAPEIVEGLKSCFLSPRVKELVLSPTGLRIVWLAEEADRGRYLLFRDAEMGTAPLPPAVLVPLLDRLCDLSDSLEGNRQP